MKELFTCFLLLLALSGCAKITDITSSIYGVKAYETGIYVSQEQMNEFIDGKTNQSFIVEKLGHPNNKAQINNNEIWYYDYSKVAAYSYEENINESCVFEFNNKGILTSHYKTNQRNSKTGNPLLDYK